MTGPHPPWSDERREECHRDWTTIQVLRDGHLHLGLVLRTSQPLVRTVAELRPECCLASCGCVAGKDSTGCLARVYKVYVMSYAMV